MGAQLSQVVFQPPEATYTRDQRLIWLKTRRGQDIPAFFMDYKQHFTLLFSHGNAEDLGKKWREGGSHIQC